MTLDFGIYGCECPSHEPRRQRALKARELEGTEVPWWLSGRTAPERRS